MRPPHQSDRTTTSVTGVLRQSILPAEWSARSSVCLISIACFLVPLSFFPVSLCVKPGIVSPTTHNLHCTRRLSSSFTAISCCAFLSLTVRTMASYTRLGESFHPGLLSFCYLSLLLVMSHKPAVLFVRRRWAVSRLRSHPRGNHVILLCIPLL